MLSLSCSTVTIPAEPSLLQRCARFRCHSAVLVFRCHNAVLVFAVTTLCWFSLSQRSAGFHCHNAVLVFAITTQCSFSLPQRCARFRCHNAVLVFDVTTLCSSSLSQRCARLRCHNAVLVFAVTALCSFSLSQRFAHRCLTAVIFLLCSALPAPPMIMIIIINPCMIMSYSVNETSYISILIGVVVDRTHYSRIFQFPQRNNVKISEYPPNFNVFKPRLVCR